MGRRSIGVVLLALLALASIVPNAAAQVRRGRAPERPPRWAPVAVGARFGYDQRAQGEVVGLQVRIPLVRSGIVELVPNVDRIFVPRSNETQYGIDIDWVPAGRAGGVMIGGGLGWRDSVLGAAPGQPRTTFFGYSARVGGKNNLGPLQLEIALRWTFLNDTDYRPNSATFGLNLPLWGRGPER